MAGKVGSEMRLKGKRGARELTTFVEEDDSPDEIRSAGNGNGAPPGASVVGNAIADEAKNERRWS